MVSFYEMAHQNTDPMSKCRKPSAVRGGGERGRNTHVHTHKNAPLTPRLLTVTDGENISTRLKVNHLLEMRAK